MDQQPVQWIPHVGMAVADTPPLQCTDDGCSLEEYMYCIGLLNATTTNVVPGMLPCTTPITTTSSPSPVPTTSPIPTTSQLNYSSELVLTKDCIYHTLLYP